MWVVGVVCIVVGVVCILCCWKGEWLVVVDGHGRGTLGIDSAVIADDVDGQCDTYECKGND